MDVRGSMPRAALFLSLGVLLSGCAGAVGRGAGEPVTLASAARSVSDVSAGSPPARVRGIVTPVGPGGRIGTWPGPARP